MPPAHLREVDEAGQEDGADHPCAAVEEDLRICGGPVVQLGVHEDPVELDVGEAAPDAKLYDERPVAPEGR